MSVDGMEEFIEGHIYNCERCQRESFSESCPEYIKDCDRADARADMAYESEVECGVCETENA